MRNIIKHLLRIPIIVFDCYIRLIGLIDVRMKNKSTEWIGHLVDNKSKIFTVNILTDKQKNLSQKFADPKTKENRFDDDLWKYRTSGAPVLINALAFIDCKVDSVFLSGDHHIFVGRVIKLGLNKNSKPLIYHRGKYSVSD